MILNTIKAFAIGIHAGAALAFAQLAYHDTLALFGGFAPFSMIGVVVMAEAMVAVLATGLLVYGAMWVAGK